MSQLRCMHLYQSFCALITTYAILMAVCKLFVAVVVHGLQVHVASSLVDLP